MKYILTFLFALISIASFSQIKADTLAKADTLFFHPPFDFEIKLPELNGETLKYSIEDLRRISREARKANDSTRALLEQYLKADKIHRIFLWDRFIENIAFSRTLTALVDEGLKRTIRIE